MQDESPKEVAAEPAVNGVHLEEEAAEEGSTGTSAEPVAPVVEVEEPTVAEDLTSQAVEPLPPDEELPESAEADTSAVEEPAAISSPEESGPQPQRREERKRFVWFQWHDRPLAFGSECESGCTSQVLLEDFAAVRAARHPRLHCSCWFDDNSSIHNQPWLRTSLYGPG